MPKIIIIPPAFDGDIWFVEIRYGMYSSAYAHCETKQEAKDKAAEATEWIKDMG